MEIKVDTIHLERRLDAASTPLVWQRLLAKSAEGETKHLIIDAGGVEYCDTSGIAMLLDICRKAKQKNSTIELCNLPESVKRLMDKFDPEDLYPVEKIEDISQKNIVEEIGKRTQQLREDVFGMLEFLGGVLSSGLSIMRGAGKIRKQDFLDAACRVGADALPIVALLSFLLGVILAFQAAVPMRMFGAEMFVADLLGLTIFRELGPLITAIILAGRTGAAYAAEIGTMKVNEEVNALTTMGLNPVIFLAIPRLLAVVAMAPLLTLFADVIALIGGGLVMLTFNIPLGTFADKVVGATGLPDLLGGLFKVTTFGLLIAGAGCLRGFQTGNGASAVGNSATKAVVTSIVLIIALDGIFAGMFYYLGI